MLVKICGLTRAEDAQLASELGCDFLGFIFAEKSKRRVKIEEVREITRRIEQKNARRERVDGAGWFVEQVQKLPSKRPLFVGVFQDQSVDYMNKCAVECGLDLIQLHGEESHDVVSQLKLPVIRSIPVSEEDSYEIIQDRIVFNHFHYILLDTKTKHSSGGTGQVFDWTIAQKIKHPFLLAGGLTCDNIEDVKAINPWAIDVSSGVEISPGIKDHEKLKAFMRRVC